MSKHRRWSIAAALLVGAVLMSGCYIKPEQPDLQVRPVERPTRIYGDSTLIEVKAEVARLRPGVEVVSIAGISPCHVMDDMLDAVRSGKRVVLAFSGVPSMGQSGSCMLGRDSDDELPRVYVADIGRVVEAAPDRWDQVVIALSTVWPQAVYRSQQLRNSLIYAGDQWGVRVVDAATWVSPDGAWSETQPAWWWEAPQQNGVVKVRGPDGGHQCLYPVPDGERTLTGPPCDAEGSPGVRRYALGLAAAISI